MHTGERYVLALNGSFNGNDDLTDIPAGQFATGTRNGNTHNGGFEKRGGAAVVGSQISAGLISLGGGQLLKRSTGTRHLYYAADDGNVYRDGVSILSSRDTSAYTHFTPIDNTMFICNGVDAVKVDTGSAVATISGASADWSGSNQPKKIIVHTKAGSRRAFGWGVPGKENYLYYSSTGAFETFTGGTSGNVFVDMRHGQGIIDCVSKDGTLWIFGKEETFILDDSDSTVANWGVYRASFAGGVHSPRLTCVANNSIFAMNTQGDIYEVQTAEQLRDFVQASIAEPFFIHTYIKNNWDLTKIDQFHMAYEPKTRSLRIFGVRQNQTVVDECLVFYLNQQKWGPPHDGVDNASDNDTGYKAATSFTAQASDGTKLLYTQDYNGQTWELESEEKTDNDNAYTTVAITPWLDFDLEGLEKRFPYATLTYKSRGDYLIDILWAIDGSNQVNQSLSLEATGAVLDSFELDTDTLGVVGVDEKDFELGNVGRKIRLEISNDGASEDFFLSKVIFPFLNRGIRRQ